MSHSDLAVALTEFRQILSSDQTAQLDSLQGYTPTADDVIHLTNDIVKENSTRKSRVFASRVQGLLSSVQQYCTIVDTYAGPNQIASLVWGSIKLALLVSSNYAEYFDKLSERVAQLSNYCPRLSEYEKLFPQAPRLQQALSDFYAIVVVFCSKALKGAQEKGINRFLKSIWKSFKIEFKDIEENLSLAKDEITEELQLASEQAAHGFRRLLTAEIEDNRTARLKQVAEMHKMEDFREQQTLALHQNRARQVQKILKEDERQKIRLLRRIPNHDYAISLRQAQALRCEGTCHWILGRPEFRGWIDQTDSKHLWCYGIPGCGKTILMGYIISHLQTIFAARDDIVIIYYFFDSFDKTTLLTLTFLRCILHQVIRLEALLPDSQRRLESLFMDRIDQAEPDTRELIELFLYFFGRFKNAFLLIDGLDEADKSHQRNVIAFLKATQKLSSARILATNHPDLDMSKVLYPSQILQINPEDVKGDIEVFIQSKIDEHVQDGLSVCSNSLLDTIKYALLSGAQEMFLWVDMQFKAILDVCEEDGTPDRIPDLFANPPQKVTELYRFALLKLSKDDTKLAEIAKKIFQWAIWGERPLTIGELEEAVSITADQASWASPFIKLDPSKLCKICGNLVKYDKVNERVLLAHHSVLSFLLSCSDIPGITSFVFEEHRAEPYLTNICLQYLSFTNFHQAVTRTSNTINVRALNQPSRLVSSVLPTSIRPLALLDGRSSLVRRARQIDVVDLLRSQLSAQQSSRIDPSFQLLDYCKAYWHSHCHYVERQDVKGFARLEDFVRGTHLPPAWKPWSLIPDSKSLPHWNLFLWAIREGHTSIFHVWQNIIRTEEDRYWDHLWMGEGRSIFALACETSSMEQLEIILGAKRGEKHLVRPSIEESIQELVRACSLGHLAVMERLLQENADVNTVAGTDNGRTALQAAAKGGHLAIVERLLQENADVNAAAGAGNYEQDLVE